MNVAGNEDRSDFERNAVIAATARRVASPSDKWFCVLTNPNCQTRAELELHSLGYRTFIPKIRKWATHARVKRAVNRPLLGRYAFVEVDEHQGQSFHTVRCVNGVESFVGMSGEPVQIPTKYVNAFRQRFMAGEWDFIAKDELPIGARVRVIEGEFENLLATLVSRSKGRPQFKLLGTNLFAKDLRECSVRAA